MRTTTETGSTFTRGGGDDLVAITGEPATGFTRRQGECSSEESTKRTLAVTTWSDTAKVRSSSSYGSTRRPAISPGHKLNWPPFPLEGDRGVAECYWGRALALQAL